MKSFNLSRINILLVENNPFTAKMLRCILRVFRCHNIRTAENGAEALEIMHDGYLPDVILTNWTMPVMDGIELTRIIRQGDTRNDPFVPIIIITAHTDINHIVAARDVGVHEILAMPLSPKKLYMRLAALLDRPRPFIRSKSFFGPDRRRRESADFPGQDQREVVPA